MTPCNKKSCKPQALQQLADKLHIIAEPNRLKILCLLSLGTKCVCEIEKELDLKQNLVSHHLKVLRENDLVSVKKKGLWMNYSLKNKSISTIITHLTDILHA